MMRPIDDDADTPRFERARSQSGEVDTDEPPRRRRPYIQSGDERALNGFRAKDTGRMDAVPEPSGPESAITPRPVDLTAEADRLWRHVEAAEKRTANLIAEIHQVVTKAVPTHIAPEKSDPVKKVRTRVVEYLLTAMIGGAFAWVADGYRSVRSELAQLHDHVLTIEERLSATERTLGAIVVPRITPYLLTPGGAPGKDPP